MGRLCTATVFHLLLVATAAAQQSAGLYSVVGDVERPQTYRFEANAPVSVSMLLQTAGIIERGNAMILRGSPLVAVSREQVDLSRPYPGSTLSPGDIVVFRSESGLIPGKPNACVLIGDHRAVLPLEQGSQSASALLQQCGQPPELSVPVTRVGSTNATSASLSGNQQIQHGDVADLSALSIARLNSEQLFTTPPESLSSSATEATSPAETTSISSPVESAATPPVTAWSAAALDLSPPDEGVSVSTSEDATEASETPFRVASLQEITQELEPTPPATAITDAAHLASNSTNAAIMNTLFIGGLLFAMGLIFVGWIRTKREREIAASVPTGIGDSIPMPIVPIADDHKEPVAVAAPQPLVGTPAVGEITPIPSESPTQSSASPAFEDEVWVKDEQPPATRAVEPTIPQPATDNQNVAAAASSESGWSDLEDLIQNRLPIEQKEAQLPLNVSLYGKPAGPKQIRIDAAHGPVDAPKFMKRKTAKADRHPVETKADPVVKTESETQARPAPRPTPIEISRLDKALNFLEEQSE